MPLLPHSSCWNSRCRRPGHTSHNLNTQHVPKPTCHLLPTATEQPAVDKLPTLPILCQLQSLFSSFSSNSYPGLFRAEQQFPGLRWHLCHRAVLRLVPRLQDQQPHRPCQPPPSPWILQLSGTGVAEHASALNVADIQ